MAVNPSTKTWPVVVVGGGIVGICSALALLKCYPKGVLLLDPGNDFLRASFGNAGVVSPASIFPVAGPGLLARWRHFGLNQDAGAQVRHAALPKIVPWLRSFAAHCNQHSRDVAANALQPLTARAWDAHTALAKQLGTEHLLTKRGWIRLYASEASWVAAQSERDTLRSHGVELTDLTGPALHDLEPATRRFLFGSLVNHAGAVVRPQDLIQACHQAFLQSGGMIFKGKARRWLEQGTHVKVVGQDIQFNASQLVIANGAGASEFLAASGYSLPYAAERGYHQHFDLAPQVTLTRPCYDVEGGYVVSPMNLQGSHVRVLSGIELGHHRMRPRFSVLGAAVARAKQRFALQDSSASIAWYGDRPSTPDGLPVLGKLANNSKVICAFGHGHIGLSTGPLTGQIVAAMAREQLPPFGLKSADLEPFMPARF